jgi:hypothetical protein
MLNPFINKWTIKNQMFSLHAIKWKLCLSNFNVSFFELKAKNAKECHT